MFHAHLLILATSALLQATITTPKGPPQHMKGILPTVSDCCLAGREIAAAAAPKDSVLWTCTKRFGT